MLQDLPLMAFMGLTVCFGVSVFWQEHKEKQHTEQVKRVRKCEHVRHAYRLIERGRHERKYNKYHGLV